MKIGPFWIGWNKEIKRLRNSERGARELVDVLSRTNYILEMKHHRIDWDEFREWGIINKT